MGSGEWAMVNGERAIDKDVKIAAQVVDQQRR